jgi:hypothetical protein
MLMVLQCGIFPFPSKNLKGPCHETENGFNGCQVLDVKNFGLPEPIFNSFLCNFHVLILKKTLFCSFTFDSNYVNDIVTAAVPVLLTVQLIGT